MITDEQIDDIRKLVENFKEDKAWVRSEEHIQAHYTVKMLDCLGWGASNVRINQGQDVKTGKKPDILLQYLGSTLLVVESKDASKKDMLDGRYQKKTFIEQLCEYCRAEGLAWGVLTNFVEWRVYSIYQNRLYKERKYAFHDLLWENADKNDYIDLLSKEGLVFLKQLAKRWLNERNGRWDEDPVYYPKQEEIKDKFFQDLKRWRANLRAYLSKQYETQYGLDVLDLMTQKILDRLIFIDYCSDNGILAQDRLHAILHSKGNLYGELIRIFNDLDEKFNSELFAPSDCDRIKLDDAIMRPIINELANTDFRRLSVSVIGEVYENYLGELLKPGKRGVKVDEAKTSKKRKSQGIYYTPDYIVDYIVENTVGAVLKKCKTAEDIEKIRVLDPSCGSGSFLIRVFDEFLKHYERVAPLGMFHFTTRKKILQQNIYGVDLDERAVEIAKLNLLVKALEGSSNVDISGRKLLPNLKLNIRCGNSLVSGETVADDIALFLQESSKDFNDLKNLHHRFHSELDDDKQGVIYTEIQIVEHTINSKLNASLEEHFTDIDQIRPFNYSVAFPEVFNNGGFDCVVGNPPYIDSELMTKEQPETRSFISKYFLTAKGNWDLYIPFFEKGVGVLKKNGWLSLITPNKWLSAPYAMPLRIFLKRNVFKTTDCSNIKVFKAGNNPLITFIKKDANTRSVVKNSFDDNQSIVLTENVDTRNIENNNWGVLISDHYGIVANLCKRKQGVLKNYCTIENPCSVSEAYALKAHIEDSNVCMSGCFRFINTGTIDRYTSLWGDKQTTYIKNKYQHPQINKQEFKRLYPRRFEQSVSPKIIVAGMRHFEGYFDQAGEYIAGKSTIIIRNPDKLSFEVILGIINSKLITFYLKQLYKSSGIDGGINFTVDMVGEIPIPSISPQMIERISIQVDKMILLNNSLKSREKNTIQIQAIDREIDKLAYQIYGLTKQEIDLVEEPGRKHT